MFAQAERGIDMIFIVHGFSLVPHSRVFRSVFELQRFLLSLRLETLILPAKRASSSGQAYKRPLTCGCDYIEP